MHVTLNEQSQSLWQRYHFEYLRYDYKLTPNDLVIDIGAYQGEWAKEIYRRYGCKLILIEPGPWANGFQYGEVINKAAWTHDGGLQFGGDFYYTSAYEPATHGYPCFDINELLQKHENIALVKINIEGAEYDLLEHMCRGGMLNRIHELQIQFHLIEGEDSLARYDEIAALLGETHQIRWRYPFCWESWWPYRVG